MAVILKWLKFAEVVKQKKRSLPAATEQTSGIKNAKKTLADYTTHKEGMSSA